MKYERGLSKKRKIKTMNSKMTTNSQLSITEPKNQNKLSKQLEEDQSYRNGDHVVISEEREWGGWGECTGNKRHKWQVQNRQGEVKNSIGNGEAKELSV